MNVQLKVIFDSLMKIQKLLKSIIPDFHCSEIPTDLRYTIEKTSCLGDGSTLGEATNDCILPVILSVQKVNFKIFFVF